MLKKISVIIPLYNAADTIKNCIGSVIQTNYPLLEIVVVDDVSTDGSYKSVENLRREYPEIVKLVRQDINSGPAKARNTGAAHAGGDYLFFLDSDTEVLPDIFDNFVLRMEHADAVVGVYHFEPLNKGCVQKYKALLNYYFFSRRGIIEYEVFDASRAGIKADVFRKLGGFNENLGWGMDYENEEFGYRLSKTYKNLLDPSVIVKHLFPDIGKLTKTYFCRVALWMEIFFFRKKFESAGVTSAETGICTAALLISISTIPLALIDKQMGAIPLILFFVYLYGYKGFFWFVFNKTPLFLPFVLLLNIYFNLIIGMGALFGLFKVIVGKSLAKKRGMGETEKG